MGFIWEKKRIKEESAKRNILFVQENYKIMLPLAILLSAAIITLDIFNAILNFMSVYICVIINFLALTALALILFRLISGNVRQRESFDELEKASNILNGSHAIKAVCKYDDTGILMDANGLILGETAEGYIILPDLCSYRHGFFTKYSFKKDFGRLILPKPEFCRFDEGETTVIQSQDLKVVLTILPDKKVK